MPDISLQQLLSTNFSLSPSGYTGSQGAVGYTGSAGAGGGGGGSGFGYTTLSTRTYTGDGTTTAYTISSDLSANSVVVSENGILQTPGTDYTVAGTTLTFTTAPAAGVAVQIREIANTPGIGYTGSSGDIFIPKITNVQVTDNTYTVLDDTAVALTGGYIKLTGTGFASGCQVLIGTTAATSTTFVSSTEVRAQLPATAAGTYIIYLVNADGGVAIRINGVTFSDTPTWVTGSTLASSASDTAISYQLSATGATTYTLQPGSSLPPGLTLSSGGLLSGTVTGLTTETTYNFTVLATDAENQDSPRSFSITITAGDQYWKYTTTLLSPTLSALPFTRDASTNNFALSIFGDTKPNNFNPYTPGYYSNYFDGSGDFIRVPSTGTGFSSITTFTYECWIYPTASLGTNCIFDISECQPFRFVLSGSNVVWQATASGSTILTANFTWSLFTWYHLAFVRDANNNISIFINGTRYATTTYGSWGSTGTGGVNIGCNRGDTWFFPGYISNARFVKDTAIYNPTATTLTVPSVPLIAVSGTSLLACSSNRFIDASANNLAITRNGDVTVSGFVPYTPAAGTSAYGSGYFDGTGDYLSLSYNAAFNLGTGSFTWEAWIYPTNISGIDGIYGTSGGTGANPKFVVHLNAGTPSIHYNNLTNGTDLYTTATSAVSVNTWTHLAFVRNSTTWIWYINGVAAGTGSNSTDITFTNQTTYIGYGGEAYFTEFNGYISNLRLVKGTAVYTTAFTPPTAPLTAIANTSLLTLQTNQPVNNNQFVDRSTNNFLVTRAGNATQGTFSPYGENWSNFNPDSANGIGVATNAALNMGTGDFTVEAWVNTSKLPTTNAFQTTSGGYQCVFGTGPSNSGTGTQLYIGTTNLFFDIAADGGGPINVAHNMVAGQWYHIAITRSGTTFRAFINGSLVQTATSSTSWVDGYAYGIMRAEPIGAYNGAWWFGYVSNFRLIKGAAVYTGNFTPSTTPLQPVAGTSLLTCRDASIVDDSANNFTITRNGDVSVQKFGPAAGTTLPTPYYGAYFDGTGDYLDPGSQTAFALGTGDFTVECWIYATAASDSSIYEGRADGSTSNGFTITAYSSSVIRIFSGSALISSTGTTYLNQWTHVAVSRVSGTTTLYINGVSVGTTTSLADNTTGSAVVGGGRYSGGASVNSYFTGYISNFRIVKGTAVYTTNFTPSTAPLTAIANTSLLTCQSSTFVDNSINNFTITANGNSKPTTFNPFTVTYSAGQSYTPAVFGGSMYFDGNGDGLTIADATLLAFGTGDFTVEFWIYLTGYSSTTPGNILHGGLNGGFGLYLVSTGIQIARYNTGGDLTYSGTVTLNSWNHLAFTRKSGTGYIFLNGAQVASGAVSTNYSASSFNFGGGNALYYSDLRIIKGQALYTSNFVPSNAPLAAIKNTTLLVNGTGGAIYDSSTNAVFETVGDAKLNTSVVKFSGGTSMYFDGTGDYLYTPSNNLSYVMGVGDFTIELWYYPVTTNNTNPNLMGNYNTTWQSGRWAWHAPHSSYASKYSFWVNNYAANSAMLVSTTNISLNSWVHLAVTRSGTTWKLFVNGTAEATVTSSISLDNSTGGDGYYIGANFYTGDGGRYINSYISDLRITRGIARYTTNFTAPTAPFTNK